MRWSTILADPPWQFRLFSGAGDPRAGERHYGTAGIDWIASLPVAQVADRDCVLLMWAVNRDLPGAFEVVQAWGFEFKSMLTWVKMSRAAAPRIGCGYHIRNCTEQLLIATRGNPRAPEPSRRPMDVIFHPRGEHSAKPDFQYELAENYPGPWLELFHRPRDGGLFPPRAGWTFAGNEVSGLDMRDELRLLAERPSFDLALPAAPTRQGAGP